MIKLKCIIRYFKRKKVKKNNLYNECICKMNKLENELRNINLSENGKK